MPWQFGFIWGLVGFLVGFILGVVVLARYLMAPGAGTKEVKK